MEQKVKKLVFGPIKQGKQNSQLMTFKAGTEATDTIRVQIGTIDKPAKLPQGILAPQDGGSRASMFVNITEEENKNVQPLTDAIVKHLAKTSKEWNKGRALSEDVLSQMFKGFVNRVKDYPPSINAKVQLEGKGQTVFQRYDQLTDQIVPATWQEFKPHSTGVVCADLYGCAIPTYPMTTARRVVLVSQGTDLIPELDLSRYGEPAVETKEEELFS